MKTFKEWWNSPSKIDDPSLLSHRECAEQAWNYAYEMQNERIRKMDAEIKDIQERHSDSLLALRRANEQITSIAKDNGKLRTELEVADIRPMEEGTYLERIETLEEQVEWHKRRAEGWRSIAILEEQGR